MNNYQVLSSLESCVVMFNKFRSVGNIYPINLISGALGHCNSGTTLNVYAHMFQTAQARVAQAMDGAFSFLPQDSTS